MDNSCHIIGNQKLLVVDYNNTKLLRLPTCGIRIVLVANCAIIEIQLPILWRVNFFGHHLCGNKKLYVINPMATKSFLSPHKWWPETFYHQSYGNWFFFNRHTYGNRKLLLYISIVWLTTDWSSHWFNNEIWWTGNKSKPCNLNSLSLLNSVGFVLFNKQPFPYTY